MSDASFDIDRSETKGIYRGDYDNEDDSNLSYHSSDGSDKDDSDVDLSLGDGAEGTSPTATILLNSPPLGGRWMTYRTGSRK
jgi:hypothetical protein